MEDQAEANTSALIVRATLGEADARDALLRRYDDRLKRMVYLRMDRRLRARFDPSDVVQEARLTMALRLPEYLAEKPIQFYPWVRRITWEHLLKMQEKHLAQKRSVELEAAGPLAGLCDESAVYMADRIAAAVSSPSAGVIREEMSRRVRLALAELKPLDREVLELLYLEDLEPGEAADILGVQRSVIWNRHMRAIRRLTKLLKGEATGGDI